MGATKMGKKIRILDTTLRDGAQSEGAQFSLSDKLGTIMLLDNLGFDYIEAGTPASNPKDAELFERLKSAYSGNARIVAFGLTRKAGGESESDAGLRALCGAGTQTVSIVGKASRFQVESVLKTTAQENLAMIRETVAYLCEKGKRVFFDAEHFFDGYAHDPAYALECLAAARDAGARQLVLCDTNGGVTPDAVTEIVAAVAAKLPGAHIGAHFHNDAGLALANSLAAVEAGADNLQGTFLGIGERCGNTSLAALIPTLQLKKGYDVVPPDKLALFTRTAYHLAELCNMLIPPNLPYIGSSAFSHKGGMHIDGVVKDAHAFEHVDPAAVGNARKLLISEVAGRSAVAEKLGRIDAALAADKAKVDAVLKKLKQLEYDGYSYEAAGASFELMALRELGRLREYFTLLDYKIIGERSIEAGRRSAVAVVKIAVGADSELRAAEGDGPVHALDISLRSALSTFYPRLSRAHLIDYKVRVITPESATAAKVRVLIDTTDGETQWTTVGVSADIIDASFKAITDSIVYMLHKSESEE